MYDLAPVIASLETAKWAAFITLIKSLGIATYFLPAETLHCEQVFKRRG